MLNPGGKIQHRYEYGNLEWIECEYQPLTQSLPLIVGEEVVRITVEPKDVKDTCIAIFIVG